MTVRLPLTTLSIRKPNPTAWVRPSDWPTITDNADQFNALVADTGDATYTISYVLTGTGTTTISWGDGTSTTISGTSTSTVTKTYTPGTGTPCSRGYTTFAIRITKDPGITINSIRFIGTAATFQNAFTNLGVLEVYYGNNIQTANPEQFFSSGQGTGATASFVMLEYAKLPSTISWTSMNHMFFGCTNLARVIMPSSASSLQTMTQSFAACVSLRSISFPSNAINITNMQSTFANCRELTNILLPTTLNSCTTMQSLFAGCVYLQSVTIPSINNCININSLFINAYSLLWVRFTSLPTPSSANTALDAISAFNGCFSLQSLFLPPTCSSNAVYDLSSTFNNCASLRNIVFPINFNASLLPLAFQNCYNLFSVVFQSAMPSCTNLASAFLNCFQLQRITLPSSTSSSGVTMANTFQNCYSLSSITIPTTYIITSLTFTFNGCFIIQSITINSAQNSCTTLVNAFSNCFNLISLTIPTSLNACTTLASAFSNCFNLKSIVLPSTLNAVTSMQNAFSSCSSLESITMPTSMSLCTNFSNMVASCTNLTSFTFPATTSTAITSFSGIFFQCTRLRTVTLPTTRTSSLTTTGTMFIQAGQLATINNTNLLGSTAATPRVDLSGIATDCPKVTSLSFSCPMTKFTMNGTISVQISLNSLRFTNANAGQWTGSSPHINISYTSLSTTALNTLFADIAAQGNVVSKTIDITGTVGAAGLTLADRQVLTSRGWTITG